MRRAFVTSTIVLLTSAGLVGLAAPVATAAPSYGMSSDATQPSVPFSSEGLNEPPSIPHEVSLIDPRLYPEDGTPLQEDWADLYRIEAEAALMPIGIHFGNS